MGEITFNKILKPDKANDTVITTETFNIVESQKARKNARNFHPGKLKCTTLLIFEFDGEVQRQVRHKWKWMAGIEGQRGQNRIDFLAEKMTQRPLPGW